MLRVPPAKQGLEPQDLSRGDSHLGLVVEFELVLREGDSQLLCQAPAAADRHIHFRFEEAGAAPSLFFAR